MHYIWINKWWEVWGVRFQHRQHLRQTRDLYFFLTILHHTNKMWILYKWMILHLCISESLNRYKTLTLRLTPQYWFLLLMELIHHVNIQLLKDSCEAKYISWSRSSSLFQSPLSQSHRDSESLYDPIWQLTKALPFKCSVIHRFLCCLCQQKKQKKNPKKTTQ